MRALEPEVANAVREAVEALIPSREVSHPMGGHRTRIPDRICFQGIRIRPVTGCLWVSAEHLSGGAVSDTTLRARRDEWTDAGVFDAVVSEALAAYDRIEGLDLSAVSGRRQSAQGAMRWARNRQRTPVTGPSPGGNGPSLRMPTASRGGLGRRAGPTVTTA